MGNDSSSFSTCELTSSFDVTNPSPWTLHAGSCKDGTNVSVFVYDTEEIKTSVIENTIRNLKTLKHPGIIKYLSVKDVSGESWVITESVVPLETVIDTCSPEEICAGIHSLLQVLSFLHKAGLCHNNLGLSSVFVSTDGTWKLGDVDWLCRFTEATPAHLATAGKWRHEQAVAPEEKGINFVPTLSNGHTRDVYAFGHLAVYLLEYMTPLGDLTKSFQLCIEDFLNSDPMQRPQLATLLEDKLFRCDYVEIMQFLKTFTVQTNSDREAFFATLVERLYKLPPELVALRLTRPLLARFVLLEKSAVNHVIPHLLTPSHGKERPVYRPDQANPLFPEYLFKKHVIPELFKIFHVRDAYIRIVLLTHFSSYGRLFGRELLKSTILPQVLLGVRDTNDKLVSLSLRALAELVDILGGDIVIGINRGKVFTDGVPKSQTQKLENGVLHNKLNKDVKTGSVKTSGKPESPQKEERERKRQEARKRMEERKKRREERKVIVTAPSPHSNSLESDDGGPADINKLRQNDEDSTAENTPRQSEITEAEELMDSHNTGSDTEFNDTFKTESDIDLEIETELEAMESTLSQDRHGKVENETPAEAVKVDWSNIPSDRSLAKKKEVDVLSKGALKLSSAGKIRTSTPQSDLSKDSQGDENSCSSRLISNSGEFDESIGSGDDWGESWDAENITENDKHLTGSRNVKSKVDTRTGKNMKPQHKGNTGVGKKEKTSAAPGVNASSKNQILGAEFDIMAMDIKTSIREMDYFADMMPEIKPKAGDLYSALGLSDTAGQGKAEKQKSPQKSTVSFAVVETEEATEGGWDVEEGWGDS